MEKTWNDFWMTGKVEDYLSYKNGVSEDKNQKENKKEQRNPNIHGTISSIYRDGAK